MTPYTWRNFVNGVPTAREGQMEPFFLQKRHFKYKLSVKKQKTGQKTGKKPQKRGVFIGTSALIPQTVRTICRFSANGAHHLQIFRKRCAPFAEFCKRCAPFAENLQMVCTVCGKSVNGAHRLRKICKWCAPFAE